MFNNQQHTLTCNPNHITIINLYVYHVNLLENPSFNLYKLVSDMDKLVYGVLKHNREG